MKWISGILAFSVLLNGYLGMKILNYQSEIDSLIFFHTNYEEALDLATSILAKSAMQRDIVREIMRDYYQISQVEVDESSLFESPIAFEFDSSDRITSAKVGLK